VPPLIRQSGCDGIIMVEFGIVLPARRHSCHRLPGTYPGTVLPPYAAPPSITMPPAIDSVAHDESVAPSLQSVPPSELMKSALNGPESVAAPPDPTPPAPTISREPSEVPPPAHVAIEREPSSHPSILRPDDAASGTFHGLEGLFVVMDDFDHFVAGNLEQLLKTAYLITWDAGEAEDLVQECLSKVARRWPRVRGMAQPRAYARRILVNLALDDARGRARRRGELDATAVVDEPARDLLVGLETRAELIDALARLTPRQRAVLVLRYFNDLTEAQTAEVLGCSPGTVKSNTSRGLARLREVLAPIPHPTREL
jgi:RNA polymerase sigma-70 factor (sigma-E family)